MLPLFSLFSIFTKLVDLNKLSSVTFNCKLKIKHFFDIFLLFSIHCQLNWLMKS